MTARTFYRLSLWIPIVLPLAVMLAVHGLDVRPTGAATAKFFQIMLISIVYGGIPYGLLAIWATWWIGPRSEPEIRRRALVAPLWLVGVWSLFAMVQSILSGKLEMFVGLVGLGTVFSLILGYGYVALVLALRAALGRAGFISPVGEPARPGMTSSMPLDTRSPG